MWDLYVAAQFLKYNFSELISYKCCKLQEMWFLLKNSVLRWFIMTSLFVVVLAMQSDKSAQLQGSKSYFAVLLSVSTVGHDMTYAIVTEDSGGKSHKFISRQEFINIALGKWRLKPNIKQENLLDKYGIAWGYDEETDQLVIPALDSLWKVRYKNFPYLRGVVGWANGDYMPSAAQQIYLADSFKVRNINTEFFSGDEFWKLLQSVQSNTWRDNYKSMFD